MTATRSDPVAALRSAVGAAVRDLADGREVAEAPSFERPPKPEFGDYSTNAALLAAPALGLQPRELAGQIGEKLRAGLPGVLERVEVAGPGFLNLFLAEGWFAAAATAINAAGPGFGSGVAAERAERILVEFVSANPTGPVTVASGRHAAYGDSLSRILEFAGHTVEREYYLNDAGGQVRLFGQSIAARITGGEVPEGGYEGEYVAEIAATIAGEGLDPADTEALAARGVELMRSEIEASLEAFRVHFDRFVSERALREAGALEAAVERVRESGYAYESDGAIWMRTSDLGDDKDRVIVRADGEPTYFAPDIAYHRDKYERGWELLIDVLGADHHGYVARLQAVMAMLGAPEGALEVPLMQLVHLVEGGERAQMSKRKGEFAALDELVADIGVDAARFFLVQRSHDSTIDLDLDIARKRSNENPVYYVQYAHARICSIFRASGRNGGEPDTDAGAGEGATGEGAAGAGTPMLLEASERALACRLLELPDQIARAEQRREPHGLGAYARDVAADFHAFYRDCPVLKAPEPLRSRRLELCEATAAVIATTLSLLGIEAPEEM